MTSFGIIFCGYNTADLLPRSLAPWIAARRAVLGGHQFKICAVACPFEGFDHGDVPNDNTVGLLEDHRLRGDIDRVVVSACPVKETKARGEALRWLVEQGVEVTIMVDSDEFWSQEQILAALTFVQANPFSRWFRVCYKQMVFSKGQYLKEPFTPPRIHRVYAPGGYRAAGFWDDNNVYYARPWEEGTANQDVYRDVDCASLTIPQEKVWIEHETWVAGERSKAKIAYQRARWGHSSFRWDETKGLCFDESYYAAKGEPLPEVISLDTLP